MSGNSYEDFQNLEASKIIYIWVVSTDSKEQATLTLTEQYYICLELNSCHFPTFGMNFA